MMVFNLGSFGQSGNYFIKIINIHKLESMAMPL